MNVQVAIPGGWELVLIVLVVVLFFGAAKLPELARGSGRALRIFKTETRGLTGDATSLEPDIEPDAQPDTHPGQRGGRGRTD